MKAKDEMKLKALVGAALAFMLSHAHAQRTTPVNIVVADDEERGDQTVRHLLVRYRNR